MHTFKQHMRQIYRVLAIIILILLPLLLLCIGLTFAHFYTEKEGVAIKTIPVVDKIKTKFEHNKVVIKPEDYNEITLKRTEPVYVMQPVMQPVVQPVVQQVAQDKVVLVVMKNQQQKKKVVVAPKKKVIKKVAKVNKKVEQKEVNITRGSISIEKEVKKEVVPETVFVKNTTVKEIIRDETVEEAKDEVKADPVPVERRVKKRKLIRKAPVEEVVEKKPCTTCKKKQNVETTILIETEGDYEVVGQPRVVDSVVVPASGGQKVVETVKRVVS